MSAAAFGGGGALSCCTSWDRLDVDFLPRDSRRPLRFLPLKPVVDGFLGGSSLPSMAAMEREWRRRCSNGTQTRTEQMVLTELIDGECGCRSIVGSRWRGCVGCLMACGVLEGVL
jgi:hypothetical protein